MFIFIACPIFHTCDFLPYFQNFEKTAFATPLKEQISVKEGEGVTLECELFNPQHNVIWLKNEKQIYPSQKFTVTSNGVYRTLTIAVPVKFDEAVYSCALKKDRSRRSSTKLDVDASKCLVEKLIL